jgi:putative transposase
VANRLHPVKVVGWGWYYLCTILDDYSCYTLAWRLSTNMAANDVEETLQMALDKVNVTQVTVRHRPRLLSDNGPAFLSQALKEYLQHYRLQHIRGAPYHSLTQGKLERYHRSMKNVVKLQAFYFPWGYKAPSLTSSLTTTTNGITSHWTISRRLMSILAELRR